MAFVSMKDILATAKNENYAIAQININGILWIQAAYQAAENLNAPIILAASDRLIKYLGGFKTVYEMVRCIKEEMKITVPTVLHLDHGASVEHCLQAIDTGFNSVMYDGSHLPIQQNIHNTKIVCEYAKKHGVSVEAEVGCIGGTEDGVTGGIHYANIAECVEIVEQTGIDALAAALGSVHGNYTGEPKLGFAEMKSINERINVPLVLHGASGIPIEQVKKCIKLGHAKINFNTELVSAWAISIKKTIEDNPHLIEPRLIMEPAKSVMIEEIQKIITNIGSKNRA